MQNSSSEKFVSCPPEEIWIDKNEFLTSLKKSSILLKTIITKFTHILGEKKFINKPVQVRPYRYIAELPASSAPSHNHHKNLSEETLPVFLL